MPKMKDFLTLSQRQKSRRLKQMHISENFVQELIKNLNQNENSWQNCNKKTSNSLVDKNVSDHVSQFVFVDENICNNTFENIVINAAIEQSNTSHISTFSTSEKEHPLFNKQISFREKLIVWTDKYKVEQKTLTSLLHLLKSEDHDNLPNDGRTLMNTPRSTTLYKRSGGYYYHYGLQNGITDKLKQLNMSITNHVIYINVNIDGLPISKSSKSQLWPILAQIVSTDSVPFLVGAYHGYQKPTSDNFLQHFVTELKQLSTIGFTYKNNIYYVKIKAVICDSPARSFVTCIKGHNGYFGCSKCTVEGNYKNGRMLFLDQNCRLLTDESFNLRENPEHHTGTSILESIPLPMVTIFSLDYMHLVYLGQMKKLLNLWLRGSTRIKCRLSGEQIKNLNKDMLVLKKYVCSEFVRVPSTVEELDRWKATEF